MLRQRLSSAIAAAIKKNLLLVALSTTLLVIILSVILGLAPSASVAQSTKWCQCTEYVANRFGLSGYPNAGDWDNGYLTGKGFYQLNSPQNGAIVVLNPNVAGATGLGHVGIVEQYTTAGNSLKLSIRGTNQPGTPVANEVGCNNLTIWSNNTNIFNSSGVTYWIRTIQLNESESTDVDGDGKADAIVVNDNAVTVRRSTGSDFSGNESWTTNPYYGTKGTFFADVTGDGKADAIVVNDNAVTVRRSTGSDFSGNESWTTNPYYGTKGTFFASLLLGLTRMLLT